MNLQSRPQLTICDIAGKRLHPPHKTLLALSDILHAPYDKATCLLHYRAINRISTVNAMCGRDSSH